MVTVPHIAIISNASTHVLVLRAHLCFYCPAMCWSFQYIIGGNAVLQVLVAVVNFRINL